MKIFYSAYFFLYLFGAFVWPTLRTFRKTGINPVTFGSSDNGHDFIGKWFKIITGLVLIAIASSWLDTTVYNYLLPISYLQHDVLQFAGAFLALLSLLWTATAQKQMGNAWRIGVDHRNKTPLVQHGLFSVSRNPVFLGMLLSLTGFFLMLPNLLTLLVLFSGYLLIQIQIRLEEEFLLLQHGDLYKHYLKAVRRLI